MKKFLALALALVMSLSLVACGGNSGTTEPGDTAAPEDGGDEAAVYRVAMITDYGDITDQSFNQTTYEACKEYCDANGLDFEYFKPAGDSTAERVAMVEKAVDQDYNVIVMPGYAFAGTIVETQDVYPDVTFIGLDVSEYDIEDCFYNHDADGKRTELLDAANEPHVASNVYCAVYQEELCGYMAGYAAVKLGYTHLGFLGGMAVPAVQRYGYGFVQGADAAAAETGADVKVEYVYGNQFFGDADITAYMDTWYQTVGVEVVFACGGGIYASAAEAAAKVEGAKVIGVDVDQAAIIDGDYGEGMTVTSAMKGLAPTVKHMLEEVQKGNFANYGGKVESLGLVSGDDPASNYVQIPMETTQWGDGFSQDDYKALVKAMFDGSVTVSSDISAEPAVTTAAVTYYGNIK
jgi:basic membrane protein A